MEHENYRVRVTNCVSDLSVNWLRRLVGVMLRSIAVALFRVALGEFQWKGFLVRAVSDEDIAGGCMLHMSPSMYVRLVLLCRCGIGEPRVDRRAQVCWFLNSLARCTFIDHCASVAAKFNDRPYYTDVRWRWIHMASESAVPWKELRKEIEQS